MRPRTAPTWGALPPAASWGQHGGEVWGARAAASTLSFTTATPEPAAPRCWSIPSPAEPLRSDRCLRVPKPGFGNTLRALRLEPRPYPADPAPCHRGAAEVLWERSAAGGPLAVQCAALGGAGGSPQQPPVRRGGGSTPRQPRAPSTLCQEPWLPPGATRSPGGATQPCPPPCAVAGGSFGGLPSSPPPYSRGTFSRLIL